MTMTTTERNAATLAEAKALLQKRGNSTDIVLFERATKYIALSAETHQTSTNGIISKRRRADVISDGAVAEELTTILSWRLGFTPNFWRGAAIINSQIKEQPK